MKFHQLKKDKYYICLVDVSPNLLVNELVKLVGSEIKKCELSDINVNDEELFDLTIEEQDKGVYMPVLKEQYYGTPKP